jgi:hypothetical protein
MEEFGKEMAGIMLEALGVGPERLAVEAWIMAGHYYPPCPEPELVVGSLEHTDPCVLTVLAQDNVGGLQFRLDGGSNDGSWVDVPPVPGALVVNIGDVLKVRMHLRVHLSATTVLQKYKTFLAVAEPDLKVCVVI